VIKLAAFGGTLILLLGGGFAVGKALDPAPPRTQEAKVMTEMKGEAGHGAMAADPIRGLAVAEHGLRLVVAAPEFPRGRTETLRFRVVDRRGQTVRDFDVEHTKRMHLIVVRRDMTGFQHLHPRQNADGEWTVPLRLESAGSYRVFADFSHDGEATTLATDLRVDGAADLVPLPAPATEATTDDGYSVRMDEAAPHAGKEDAIRFTVLRGGKAVEVEPYLGANGHLVALREGDLAFLHVHPLEGTTEFESTFPTVGRYRLFLQFKHAGRVHTLAFTQEVI
jgi:hypothetical protein